jgi:hypothetical protein
MTQHSQNGEGVEARYLLVKRDLYYAPNNHGYTGIKANAGRYMASEADEASGVIAIHEDDAPMFAKGCWEDVKTDHLLSIITAHEKTIADLRQSLTAREPATADVGREAVITAYDAEIKAANDIHRQGLITYDTLKHTVNCAARMRDTALSRAAPSSGHAMAEGERYELALRNIEAGITGRLRDWEGSPRGDAFSLALSIVQTERMALATPTDQVKDAKGGGA